VAYHRGQSPIDRGLSIKLIASLPQSEDVPAPRANSKAGLGEHLVAPSNTRPCSIPAMSADTKALARCHLRV
jgi:hypothetical protein